MNKIAAVLSTVIAVAASSSALAFRDETQSALIARAMEAKRAQQLANTKANQSGLAGPTGVPGRVDPKPQTNRNRRDPTVHP